jgi:hypothetical protein
LNCQFGFWFLVASSCSSTVHNLRAWILDLGQHFVGPWMSWFLMSWS